MAVKIVVLNDGETWDIPENCTILTVTDDAYDQIAGGQIKARNLDASHILNEEVIDGV